MQIGSLQNFVRLFTDLPGFLLCCLILAFEQSIEIVVFFRITLLVGAFGLFGTEIHDFMTGVHVDGFEDIFPKQLFILGTMGLRLQSIILKLEGARTNLGGNEPIA